MFRFTKVLALSVVLLVLSIGSAWAVDYDAPYAFWSHTSYSQIVNGKTDFAPTDPDAYQPHFRWMYLMVMNVPEQNSTITINAKHNAYVLYDDSNRDETFSGEKTFFLWQLSNNAQQLNAGDENGSEAEFGSYRNSHLPTQTAFSEQPFSFSAGDINVSGVFPVFHTTEKQLAEKCVPYIELIVDNTGKMLTGVRWRFVNSAAPETAVKWNDSNYDVRYVKRLDIRFRDSGKSTITERIDKGFKQDESMEGEKTLTTPIAIDDILYIRPYFNYEDSTTDNSELEYSWRFYLSGVVTPPTPNDPTQPNPDKPTTEEVENAANIANSNLVEPPTEMNAAETTNITTGTNVTFANSEVKSRTSSIIAVNQNVAEGGAVVLAAAGAITMPLNSQSLSGLNLVKPNSFEELLKQYAVLKYFENGRAIDLLATYRGEIFSLSETGVTLNAVVTVIDGPVPTGETDVKYPDFGDGRYGVKLVEGTYLFVFDGDRNGTARDPIALVQVEDDNGGNDGDDDNNNGGGGSSGCNTGLIAILGLVVAPLVSRKK